MLDRNKILIVAAHPDDEILGCGGTVAKYAKNREIYVLILGEGITSRYLTRQEAPKKKLAELKEKAKEVARFLGIRDVFFLDLPDQRFETVPFLEITKKIEEIIKKIEPQVIFTHSSADLNLDHRIAFNAILTATRPVKNCPVKEVYSFEIPSSTEWGFHKINGAFSPNVFEDISSTIEKKIKAIGVYIKIKNKIKFKINFFLLI
ncbi:PIG-L family deacetylase [Patescibacteria group bacterium]|nr:PIG-L family deacetylase [Patescibacteria group bacterium]